MSNEPRAVTALWMFRSIVAVILGPIAFMVLIALAVLLAGFDLYLAVADPSYQYPYKIAVVVGAIPAFAIGGYLWRTSVARTPGTADPGGLS